MPIRGAILLALTLIPAGPCFGEALVVEDEAEGFDEILSPEGEKDAIDLLSQFRTVDKKYPLLGSSAASTGSKDAQEAAAARKQYLEKRQRAFADAAARIREEFGRRPANDRQKLLAALPAVLARDGQGEPAVEVAILLDQLKSRDIIPDIGKGLAQAIGRLEDGSSMLPQPVAQTQAELAALFAGMLGELKDRGALPLALKAWQHEAKRLNSTHALLGILLLGTRDQVGIFDDAFQKLKSPDGKSVALRGMVKFQSPAALQRAQDWLAAGIQANNAGIMAHVRSALAEWPTTAQAPAADFATQQFAALKRLDSLSRQEAARQLAGLEVALFLGLHLHSAHVAAGTEMLRELARSAPSGTGGHLYRKTAASVLGLYAWPITSPPAEGQEPRPRPQLVKPAVARQVGPGAYELPSPIIGRDDKPITAANFTKAYGTQFRLLAAGEDIRNVWEGAYAAQPTIALRDLSHDGWAEARLDRDEIALDPSTGRLRFPSGGDLEVKLLGKTTPGKQLFFEWPDRVVIRGDYAYMSCGENWDAGLVKVDISDPTKPNIVGHSYIGSFARGVQLYKDYAYVANAGGGFFTVFRISKPDDPAHFSWIGRVPGLSGPGLGMDPERGLMLAVAGSQLKVMDLTDPVKPKLVSSFALRGSGSEVRYEKGLACAATGTGGVQFIDLSSPKEPKEISHVPLGNAQDVELRKGFAYVSDIKRGIIVILDIHDPAKPEEVGQVQGLNRNGIRLDIAERDDRLLLFAAEYGGGGVRIFDVTSPAEPKQIGNWVNRSPWEGLPGRGGNIADVAVQGNVAVVSNLCYGLHVLDISDPSQPKLVGEVRAAGEAGNLRVVDEKTVAVEDFGQACLVFDTEDPTNMNVVGHYPFGGRCWPGSALKRPYFYISHQFPAGITAVDLSDRIAPKPVSYLKTGMGLGALDMAVSGDHMYAVHRYGYNVSVFDLTRPASPKLLMKSNAGSTASLPSIAASRDLLLVANHGDAGPGPLSVWDITEPAFTRKISELRLSKGCSRVTVWGNIAWCAGGGRLYAVSLANPLTPRVLADLPLSLGHVLAQGGYLYATQGTRIAVYRLPSWPTDSGKWDSLKSLECLGQTEPLHPRWICAIDIRGPRAYAVAYNQLFSVQVPWSQAPPGPVSIVRARAIAEDK